MTLNVQNFHTILFDCLRQMDREATNKSFYEGVEYPTGLREYAMHVNPNRNPEYTPRGVLYEKAITNRLAALLEQYGLRVETYPPYPSGDKGDLVVHFPDNTSLWIEMKGAWTYNLHPTLNPNRNYRKHLVSESEGLAGDFHKVQKCPPRDTHVGILLVGFEAPAYPISRHDIEQMKQNARIDLHRWCEHTDEWPDGIVDGSKVLVWFWWRGKEGLGECGEAPPREEVQTSPGMSLDEMVARVRRRIEQNHACHGENWYWETYYVEFSADCGIKVQVPEPYGPPDRKNPTRKAFAQAIRRVIPMKDYRREKGLRMAREITLAILAHHGVRPPAH